MKFCYWALYTCNHTKENSLSSLKFSWKILKALFIFSQHEDEKKTMLTEHKITVNYVPSKNLVAFHLSGTTEAEEQIINCADDISLRQRHLPMISIRQHTESGKNCRLPARNQLFILSIRCLSCTTSSLKTLLDAWNPEYKKRCMLKRSLF